MNPDYARAHVAGGRVVVSIDRYDTEHADLDDHYDAAVEEHP